MKTEYELYADGNSIPEVSEITGIPRSTLRFRFLRAGILRTRKEGVRIAEKKGRRYHGKGVKRCFTPEWRQNISEGRKKWSRKNAKGVSVKPSGYVEITIGANKGRGVHRVEMEKYLGRKLDSCECVHHIDRNKSNNNIGNLELMTRSEHTRCHRLLEAKKK